MSPLSSQNIESELSYAYLHAVAAHAGVACKEAGRHEDNAGIDASLTAWGPFPNGGYREEVNLNIQLKATIDEPAEVGNCLSYYLKGVSRYDVLRSEALSVPRILVVLFLPKLQTEWLTHSDKALSLHKCAYWVSLRGAPASANKTGETIYLPKSQRFDASGLTSLLSDISKNSIPSYVGGGA